MEQQHRQALSVFSLALACLIGLQAYNAYTNYSQSAVLGDSAKSGSTALIKPNFTTCTTNTDCKSRYCSPQTNLCLPQPSTTPVQTPSTKATYVTCAKLAWFLDNECVTTTPSPQTTTNDLNIAGTVPTTDKSISCEQLRRFISTTCRTMISPRPTKQLLPSLTPVR